MAKMRAAVVGAGVISGVHFEAIAASSEVDLVAVCDIAEVQLPATVSPDVPVVTSYADLIAGGGVDVVHICTPHDLHAQMAIQALERGIHVVAEKPSGLTLAEVAAIEAALDASTAQYAVCFQNRYNPTSIALKELLGSGRIGAVNRVSAQVLWQREADYYQMRPWRASLARAGGGALINQAIHTLDLLNWFFGDITQVQGSVATHSLPIEVEDTAQGFLTHSSGQQSMFFATNLHTRNDPPQITIAAENAHIRMADNLTIEWASGQVEVIENSSVDTVAKGYWGSSHSPLIQDFYQHCLRNEPFPISIAVGKAALAAVLQFYPSTHINSTTHRSALHG